MKKLDKAAQAQHQKLRKPCDQCPWRRENHGKRHKFGFYKASNLRRLWNNIRKGGGVQSCHLTDPSHPDHVASGTKEGAKALECPGSVILVLREVGLMADANGVVDGTTLPAYFKRRKKHGLTKSGVLYWCVSRMQMADVPFFGGPKMIEVEDDLAVGLPENLEKD